MQNDICDIVDADDRRKRFAKEAKNPQKTLDAARKLARDEEMESDRDDAKAEARESGERWSDMADKFEADWLRDNWDEEREQKFIAGFNYDWRDHHGQEYPASDFAPAKKGGAR
jgi:hypothetical protein